jgi:hypothetical protein
MNASGWLKGIFCSVLLIAVSGCQNPPAGDLEDLDDANGDGYGDVVPPDGVDFNEDTNIKVSLENEIDIDDVAALAEQYGVDPSLIGFATITIEMTLTLDYGDGITDVLEESETIAPFDKRFEVACPESALVGITVTATAPVVGEQIIFEQDVELTEGVEFECGETFGFAAFINDDGFPEVEMIVEDED